MEKIAATRNDPLLNAANFVERLDVDAAREWHMDYKEFNDKCTEMRIRLNMVGSQQVTQGSFGGACALAARRIWARAVSPSYTVG